MMKQNHLTADRITALKKGTLAGPDMIEALNHIGECEECAAAFAECFAEDELLELPDGFRSSVAAKVESERQIRPAEVHRTDGNAIRIESKKKMSYGAKKELFGYSFRVGIAACITLFLLFSGTINQGLDLGRSIHTDLAGIQTITENLKSLSDRLVDFDISKEKKEV